MAANPPGGSGIVPPTATAWPAAAARSRGELQAALFRPLDCDGNGFLSCSELQVLSQALEFEGDTDAWVEEYADLCRRFGDHGRA